MGFYIQDGKLTGFDGKEEKVVIPKNVRTIQDNTFKNKEHIVNIQIPKEVLSIGVGVSYNCPLLLSIDVDSENPHYKSVDGNLYTKDGKTLVQYATGKRDRHFDVPEGVEEISSCAFCGAIHLRSVKLPGSVEIVGSSAFASCKSLQDVTISDSVSVIGEYAFYNCTSLRKITIPSSVTAIGEDAFEDCTGLTIYCEAKKKPKGWARGWKPFGVKCYLDVKFPLTAVNEEIVPEEEEKDTSLDFKIKGGVLEEYLGNDKIVILPSDVTEIAVGVFSGKSFIKLIVLPSGLTKIGTGAFTDCKGLEKIVIPKSVEIIERTSFSGCENLVICCERGEDEIPDGWNNTHYGNWNVSNCPIVWKYTNK